MCFRVVRAVLILCRRKNGLIKPVSDGRQNLAPFRSLKSAFPIQGFSILIFNWTSQPRKLRVLIQHARRIHASEKLEFPVGYEYQATAITPQQRGIRHDPPPQHRRRWLLLSLLLLPLARSQRDTSVFMPVSSTRQHPMAAVRCISDIYFVICCARCSFGGFQRNPQRRDCSRGRDGGEHPAGEVHTLLEKEARRHQRVRMRVWAQVLVLDDEELSDPTSIYAKQFRTDTRLPCTLLTWS